MIDRSQLSPQTRRALRGFTDAALLALEPAELRALRGVGAAAVALIDGYRPNAAPPPRPLISMPSPEALPGWLGIGENQSSDGAAKERLLDTSLRILGYVAAYGLVNILDGRLCVHIARHMISEIEKPTEIQSQEPESTDDEEVQ